MAARMQRLSSCGRLLGNAAQEPVHGRPRRPRQPSGTRDERRTVTETANAVFLSYASQDAEAVGRISEALRAAGIEVWFDQSELRGGDAWDASIRRQIKSRALSEGYFRLEWKLAIDRSHLMATERAFLLPVAIDASGESDTTVPDRFR